MKMLSLYLMMQRDHQGVVDLLKRPLQVHLCRCISLLCWPYLSLRLINRLAFELFFESNPIISLALATAVGAVLIFSRTYSSILKKAQCVEIDPPKF